MDGNFSAEHMKCRTTEAETPLSAGMAFMTDPNSYKAHLNTGKEIAQCYVTAGTFTRRGLRLL
jgi:hypothetical protein